MLQVVKNFEKVGKEGGREGGKEGGRARRCSCWVRQHSLQVKEEQGESEQSISVLLLLVNLPVSLQRGHD